MEWHSGPGIRVANTPLDKLPYHVFTMCARLLLNLHNRSAIALHEHDDYRSLGSISFNSNTTEYKCHKIIKQYIDSMRITYTWAYHIHYSFETLGSFVMSYIVVCEVRHNCNIEMLPDVLLTGVSASVRNHHDTSSCFDGFLYYDIRNMCYCSKQLRSWVVNTQKNI